MQGQVADLGREIHPGLKINMSQFRMSLSGREKHKLHRLNPTSLQQPTASIHVKIDMESPVIDSSKQQDKGLDFDGARSMSEALSKGAASGYKASATPPIQFIPRLERLGVGADPRIHALPRDHSLASNRDKQTLVFVKEAATPASASPSSSTSSKHVAGLDDVIVKQSTKLLPGTKVKIVSGEHAGLHGMVECGSIKDGSAVIVLKPSDEAVWIPLDHLHPEGYTDGRIPAINSNEAIDTVTSGDSQADWIHPGLVVRIRSKTWMGGKLYHKLAVIEDVLQQDTPSYCQGHSTLAATITLQSDRRAVYEKVPETVLEPTTPAFGRPCMLIRGPGKGTPVRIISMESQHVLIQILDEDILEHEDIEPFMTVMASDLCQMRLH